MDSKIKILETKKITDQKWLNLYESTFQKDGKVGRWTFASRRRGPSNEPVAQANAVVTVPILVTVDPSRNPKGERRGVGEAAWEERKLVLIKEYRVPIQAYEYHFPAGLLEAGETVENCVKRELKEEAGFDLLKIRRISPAMPSSAGLTDETSVMAFVDCMLGDGKQQLESSEDIEVILLSHAEVREWVKRPLMFAAKTYPILLMYEQMESLELK